jgi:RNA polymerase sigma-70 factor (ECF subfamily)
LAVARAEKRHSVYLIESMGTVDNLVRLEQGPSDASLVAQALVGDVTAKAQLFKRYVKMAAALAFRLTAQDGDVEDIVQDSFIAAFSDLRRLEDPASFGGWLRAIVTGTSIAVIRRRRLLRRLGFRGPDPVALERVVAASAPPDVAAELRAIYAVIDALPPDERVTVILRRVEQLSLDEIAERTNVSLATVKRRLRRASTRLERLGVAGEAP